MGVISVSVHIVCFVVMYGMEVVLSYETMSNLSR